MNVICAGLFYVLWLALGAWIIERGWRGIRDRRLIFRIPTPLGTLLIRYEGQLVRVLGAAQIAVGVSLWLSLVGVLLDSRTLNAVFGLIFLFSPLWYGVLARVLARFVTVTSRHALR